MRIVNIAKTAILMLLRGTRLQQARGCSGVHSSEVSVELVKISLLPLTDTPSLGRDLVQHPISPRPGALGLGQLSQDTPIAFFFLLFVDMR